MLEIVSKLSNSMRDKFERGCKEYKIRRVKLIPMSDIARVTAGVLFIFFMLKHCLDIIRICSVLRGM